MRALVADRFEHLVEPEPARLLRSRRLVLHRLPLAVAVPDTHRAAEGIGIGQLERSSGPVHDEAAGVLAEGFEADGHGRKRTTLELERCNGVRRHVDRERLAGAWTDAEAPLGCRRRREAE